MYEVRHVQYKCFPDNTGGGGEGRGVLMYKISYIQVNMAYALCSFYATAFLNCVYAKSEKCLKSQMCPITQALPCKQKRL